MPFPFASPDRLLARFQRTGDARALGKLFDHTAPELLRIAAWLCGNRTDAEDLLQRTFLTVLTKQGSFDPTRRAMPWLCGILGNHCKKLHEQRRVRAAAALAPMSAAPANVDPLRDAADAEFAAAVARVRRELGSPYAEVLDLHLAEGLDAKRIAERLGRPAGTVRTQIVRGLELLRRHLPRGFVAGLVLSASVQAASLASVRAAVMAQVATTTVAVTAAMTFGGMVMTKKLVWLVPTLLLMLGGGAFWWQQGNATALPALPEPIAAALPNAAHQNGPVAELALTAPSRRAAATPLDAIAPEPSFATLVVRITWAENRTPAARVGVRVLPQPSSTTSEREGVSDATGSAVVHRIRPGPCWLVTTFTELHRLDLAANTVTTVDLKARHDGFVEGRVVDAAGRAIADARLWLSDGGNPFLGFEVAHSDPAGTFRVPFHVGCHLGARKSGYAPSRLRMLNARNAPIELVLPRDGGSVRGRVVDPNGHPIADAQLRIGWPGGWVVPGTTIEEPAVTPTPASLATDASGAFLCEGIEPGSVRVFAWAAGRAPVLERVLVEPGRTSEVTFTLPAGAVVTGVVRDSGGKPVANASIHQVAGNDAMAVGFHEFGRSRTQSDGEGRYRLEDLPGGTVVLTASRDDANVTATIDLRPDAVSTWDPTLRVVPQLAGRITGPNNEPLAGLRIGAVKSGVPMASRVEVTDAEGRFTLRGFETRRNDLLIANDVMTLARRNGVVVGNEPLLVRLTADELPTASVRVRILDGDRKPLDASVLFMSIAHGTGFQCKLSDDGVTRSGFVAAGAYTIKVSAPGYGSVPLAPVQLRAGEECALADVVLEPAGQVEIRLAGETPRVAQLRLLRDDGETAAWLSFDGDVAKREVPPGSYRALAQIGNGCASMPILVRSKQTTTATLTITPAALVRFECRFAGSRPDGRVLVRVYDEGNTLVDTYELHMHMLGSEGPSRWENRLPPGTYRLEARAQNDRTATQSLTIKSASETADVVLELSAH